ncbi:MAG: hypothetical protein HQM09_04185 [Candidatus Riflebacteria bacterium]|nr:hypothetical protein [Candidatus Riflebacteria bacterium]
MPTDPFWEPVFRRAMDDPEILALIAQDTPDRMLSDLIKPNPAMALATAPFIKHGRITSHKQVLQVILRQASREESLRRVLLYQWVNDNAVAMTFPTIPPDESAAKRLAAGEFGPPLKIRIIARLDPRENAKSLYKSVLAGSDENAAAETRAQQTTGSAVLPTDTASADPTSGNKSVATLVKRLEGDLSAARSEIRELRRKLKDTESARSDADRRLSIEVEERRRLEKRIEDEQKQAISLRREVSEVQAQVVKLLAECARHEELICVGETKKSSDDTEGKLSITKSDSDAISISEARIIELEELLCRRDAAIARLEHDIDRFRDTGKAQLDAEKACKRLQERLGSTESALAGMRAGGLYRLILRDAEGTERGFRALIEGADASRLLLPSNIRPPKEAVEGEWLWLARGPNGQPFELFAPEAAVRRHISGTLRLNEGKATVENDDGVWPVFAPIGEFSDGTPVAATLLPAFLERPEGVWALRAHEVNPISHDEEIISFDTIRRRLGLISLDETALREWIHDKCIPCTPETGGLRPIGKIEALISELRRSLPVRAVCGHADCRIHAQSNPFLRSARPDELCSVCFEEADEKKSGHTNSYDFGGTRVLIVGGDAVGPHYRESLARHHLDVTWISGFESLGAMRAGLGDARLALVVLKQTSHTLLRELLPAARNRGVRVAFSPKRGVSGVLTRLVELLKPRVASVHP